MSAAIPYYEGLRFSYGLKRTANKKEPLSILRFEIGSMIQV